ncbi:hypothetical protein CERSUDRAFT_84984 [Gelatoporia subvermispora B]|uniref:Hydrophobin n=1 Tax=Ceriporiopsis subvermispora (strain B) TaxID=914234 RepID=M2PID4_CERS8|nr:hypothetical protein CERSUDRAFT_84984 [Gelatoporia subvermispora B]
MFALKSIIALALLSAPAFVLARPQGSSSGSGGQCSPAQIQCCDNVASGDSDHMRAVAKALNMNIDPNMTYGTGCAAGGMPGAGGMPNAGGMVGVGGGTTCTSAPMCCEDNSFGGLIGIGCAPIPVNA